MDKLIESMNKGLEKITSKDGENLLEDIMNEEDEDAAFDAIWGPENETSTYTVDEFQKKIDASRKLIRRHLK